MAFTCPRCGGHAFRSITLRDGSIERECRGTIVDSLEVSLVKDDAPQPLPSNSVAVGRPGLLRAKRAATRDAALALYEQSTAPPPPPDAPPVPPIPTHTHRHQRACIFIWPASDDGLYGVEASEVAS
jgi:hypothetical protein